MNTKQQQVATAAQELQYRKNGNGEYVLHCSKYTAKDGTVVGPAFEADFGHSIGVKDTQICLLNLKLLMEGLSEEQHKDHFTVLTGLNADYFAQTLQQLRKKDRESHTPSFQMSKWYAALFGDTPPFFYPMSGRPRIISIPKSDLTRPHSIGVKVLLGNGTATRTQPVTVKADIEDIVASLERQVQLERASREHRNKRLESPVPSSDTASLRSIRPGRAWAALEELLREFSDPSTEFNRLYAIDRLDEPVWRDPRTYAYFALQAREYTKANFSSKEKKWNITFSKPLLAAIKQSLANAKAHLPNDLEHGYSLTAFDDWNHPPRLSAGTPRFEIARVLIWPTGRLLTDADFAVVRSHQVFNIPLFYLDPQFVEEEPTDEYILFCKKAHDGNSNRNDLRGLAWDSRHRERSFHELKFHPLAHFLKLLQHPKLLFAVDAREILLNDGWGAFKDSNPNLQGL